MAYENRDQLMDHIRNTRDHKLAKSDVDMLRSIEGAASFSAFSTERVAWVEYRQALRDYPSIIPDSLEDDLSNLPPMPLAPDEVIAEAAPEA
jgi:hypothetical protein